MKLLKKIGLVLIYTLSFSMGYCQQGNGKFCLDAEPLCGSNQFSYPNTSGFNLAENVPDYSCLVLQLNPSWFYLQIAQEGDIELKIEQSTTAAGFPDLDVDFIIYGPFTEPTSACVQDLTTSNIVDCSYKLDVVEYAKLTNTKAGEYYLLLITNFSRKPGFITVTQISGAATTNCELLKDPIISNKWACEGETITLDASSSLNAAYYKWYEDDGSGNYTSIANINTALLDVTATNTYRADAFNSKNVLIEKYEFHAIFNQVPIVPSNLQDYTICDNLNANDGFAQFDLSTKDAEILNGLDPTVFSVSYYDNLTDAYKGVNALLSNYNNTANSEVIYTRIDNIASTAICYDVGLFNLKVNLLPEFNLDTEYILCINTNGTEETVTPPIIDTGLNTNDFSFIWRLNNQIIPFENDSKLIPKIGGNYSVEATSLSTTCSNSSNTTVIESAPPTLITSVTSNAFSNMHTIEAIADGQTQQGFEFSLDGGLWQDMGSFNNVSFGEHIISARSIDGCGLNQSTVMVIDYPHYFTPNGDSVHDQWHIVGLQNQLQAKIYLFDRYGKLLKELRPSGSGWDGTFNGELQPTGDYWFIVEYIEPRDSSLKQFKSHFTLKR
ncbi:T9SS type B sorting domain-containing protein [Mariniflexile sp. HNIBRBA6329]|uniref:T9SS type B sorting domain-containing protein n=1 Tax=Mariniflexile sp. HNIBRBA6329 TaxID=3373088 RepID=UPI00374525D5